MADIIQAVDLVNGRAGTVTVEVNGKVRTLMEVNNINVHIDIADYEHKAMGTTGTQYKETEWSGTGSMNVSYVSSIWAEIIQTFVKTRKLPRLTINVKNQDGGSKTGQQVIQILRVKIDGADIAKLDNGADVLDQDIDFKFEDFNILNKFNALN